MSSGVRIDVEGEEAIQSLLRQLPHTLRSRTLKDSLREAGELVQGVIKSYAPVRTGILRDGIELVEGEYGGEPGVVIRPEHHIRHAHFPEYGTAPHDIPMMVHGKKVVVRHPGAKAQPYFWPGFEATRDEAMDLIEQRLLSAVDALWDRAGSSE